MSEECECTEPGFCVRYNKTMTPHLQKICRCAIFTPEKCEKFRKLWLSQRPTLAGDVVHKIAQVTGIEAVVKAVEKKTGKSCGCSGRRKKMNENHAKRKNQ
jgi:hypothetical protein